MRRRILQIVKERCAILKELGMKAAFFGKEPAWLPEAVYQAHPEWRGPRCEHPRRARNTYYAPCIDQPEVLAMYRKAVAELCRQAPIETFSLLTNDSGGGICWSVSLYPGRTVRHGVRNVRMPTASSDSCRLYRTEPKMPACRPKSP